MMTDKEQRSLDRMLASFYDQYRDIAVWVILLWVLLAQLVLMVETVAPVSESGKFSNMELMYNVLLAVVAIGLAMSIAIRLISVYDRWVAT